MFKVLMLLFSAATTVSVAAQELQIFDTAVRQPLPGRTVSVGYLSIKNTRPEAVRLIKASSPLFGSIELHQHSMVNGMMQMQRMQDIEIPAGQTIKLQPGGLHLMMFRPVAPLELNGSVPIELSFSDGTSQRYESLVVPVPKQ